MISIRSLSAAMVAGAALGCSSTSTAVAEVAGRYELRSVDGRLLPDERLGGAVHGELLLTPRGQARRVVTYARSGLPDPYVHRTAGTFRMVDGRVMLTLVEEASPAASQWQITGDVRGSAIVIRYPGPTDRMVEERFVKVP